MPIENFNKDFSTSKNGIIHSTKISPPNIDSYQIVRLDYPNII